MLEGVVRLSEFDVRLAGPVPRGDASHLAVFGFGCSTKAEPEPQRADEAGVNSDYAYGERDALYRERERVEEKSPAAHSEEAPHEERPVERPHLGRVR